MARLTAWTIIYNLLFSLVLAVAFTGFYLWWQRPWIVTYGEAWSKSVAAYVWPYLPVANKNPNWLIIEAPDGKRWEATELEAALAPEIREDLLDVAKKGGWAWIGTFAILLVLCFRHGRRIASNRIMRGLEIVNANKIRRLIPRKERGDYSLAEVPLPRGSELQHAMVLGGPGTGKSLLFMEFQEQIRRRGGKMLVYDPTLEFYSRLSRPGDYLLNPLDARSQHWTPWAEIRAPYDADNLAKALIPNEANSEPFWTNAARSILAAALNKIQKHSVEELIDLVCTTNLSKLAHLVEGTDAAALLSPGNPRTALSVQATTATYTRCLRYLWAGERPVFSIRDWVARDDDSDSCLFLGAPADQQAALRPLLTCWLESFATAALSLSPSRERRIFVVIDELPTLHKLEAIPRLLAQGRKYGIAGILALQNFSQLKEIYGPAGANALAGQCSTWVTLRVPDAESAEWASRNLGEIDVTESQEAITYGAPHFRDAVRLSEMRKSRPVVSATQIQQLPNLQGYLRLAGSYPVVEVKVKMIKRPAVQPINVPVDHALTVFGKFTDMRPAALPEGKRPQWKKLK